MRGHGRGLGLDVWVLSGVFRDDGLEDVEEAWVFGEGLGGGRNLGGGADGKLRGGWRGREEGEPVHARVGVRGMDVLSSQ